MLVQYFFPRKFYVANKYCLISSYLELSETLGIASVLIFILTDIGMTSFNYQVMIFARKVQDKIFYYEISHLGTIGRYPLAVLT